MNASQIEKNVIALVENFNKEEFIYDLLQSYGISKTSITRLKKGDFNLSKVEGEVLYKKKVLFKEVKTGKLLTIIDDITKNEEALKHNPRFVIVTDYKTLLAKDTRTGLTLDTPILEIDKHFHFFLPWSGQEKYRQKNDNIADRDASYQMAKLYDILVHENPSIYEDGGHNLNIFLSRILFCFFAEDTHIFPVDGMFTTTLEQHTQNNGSDVATFLDRLFLKLNTKEDNKAPAFLKEFPYVNGDLFRNTIKSPVFSSKSRKIILECGDLNWSDINPDIFGSMIQAVVNPAYRSGLGMHYTSVPNIMKVIEPLFLNELYEEFEKNKENPKKLRQLIYRISKLKIFDPACGSGNFLIIAYKELRKLEIKIWLQISELEPQYSFVFTEVKLSQFYGIELDDFAHEMAILSLWLAEHQMNKQFVDELFDFGRSKPILPLKESGNITQGNATRVDWETVCPIDLADEVYILGNPPYLGYKGWDKDQKKDMSIVFHNMGTVNRLDYIGCWFKKGTDYIKGYNAKVAFVSTNSICQGEQVSLLWPFVFRNNIEIGFAHSSFKWTNNAKFNAGVSVVIIGLQNKNNGRKKLYDGVRYNLVSNINPYITGAPTIFVLKRNNPLSSFPEMALGSSGIDGGHLILSKNDKEKFTVNNENASKFIKPFIGGNDFLNDIERYCLWIEDNDIDEAKEVRQIKQRIDLCEEYRKSGGRDAKKAASVPHRFFYRKYQDGVPLVLPFTSSENRNYLPVDFVDDGTIISNGLLVIYDFEPYIFGVLTSRLHWIWTKAISGKLETRIRYSVNMVYNTFPFPEISTKQKEQINLHVFDILEEREKHSGKTLAQLYDPDKMPKGLKEAHHQLDLAIERCYRLKPFESDTERLEYLFKEYEKMITKNTLLEKTKRTVKVKKGD